MSQCQPERKSIIVANFPISHSNNPILFLSLTWVPPSQDPEVAPVEPEGAVPLLGHGRAGGELLPGQIAAGEVSIY